MSDVDSGNRSRKEGRGGSSAGLSRAVLPLEGLTLCWSRVRRPRGHPCPYPWAAGAAAPQLWLVLCFQAG